MHISIEPGILYLGTPVVLISTVNEDGSFNLAPMSSAFWLGWRCVLGLAAASKTPQNMIRTGECVLNLPSAALAGMVDRLALTTGSILSRKGNSVAAIGMSATSSGCPGSPRWHPRRWQRPG